MFRSNIYRQDSRARSSTVNQILVTEFLVKQFIVVILICISKIISSCMIFMNNNTRIPNNDRMRRNIKINISIRGYKNIISDVDIPNHHCIHAYPNTISYSWATLSFTTVFLTNGTSFM